MSANLIGIILLLSFFAFIYYAAKGGNLVIGFLFMAILWSIFGVIGGSIAIGDVQSYVFEGGAEGWGPTACIVMFGSWFGQVLVQTGIASTIIRKTVELGGDRPLITTILLSIVVSLIFTSCFGAGSVVAIGVIVLPILLSLGISKALALSSYLMSVGAGMYVNVVLFEEVQGMFQEEFLYDWNYLKYAFGAMAIQLVIVFIMCMVKMKKNAPVKAWAADTGAAPTTQHAPWYALITPLIPPILVIAFNWEPIPSFLVASFYALFTCGKIKSYKDAATIVPKTFFDGVVDIAPMFAFLFILPMFNRIAGANAIFFEGILSKVLPSNALVLCIVFAVLAPLALFRGPLTIFGAGTATLAVLLGLNVYSAALLLPLVYTPTIAMNISCCPTQSWNLWAINYTKATTSEFVKSGLAWGWMSSALITMLVYFLYAA
ncbi:MAG: citrate transporter [Oscillospiraceae bacterium]|nr:citrate transporter [Oscillospiraceae bacterium]